MSKLTPQDQKMFDKYNGIPDLQANDAFWRDVFEVYKDQIVPLPMEFNFSTLRRISARVHCPSGKCGECCRYSLVEIKSYDAERIVAATGMSPEELGRMCVNIDGKISLKKQSNGACYFLKNNTCSIYEARPDICYTFPVQDGIFSQTNDDKKLEQAYIRVKCLPALTAVREVITEALKRDSTLVMLPNLVVVRKEKNVEG